MLTKDGGHTMKKLLALLLSAALLCGTALPALADSETADARLTQVTQAVKTALDLDTTAYTDFHGDSTEDALAPVWYLTWTGDAGSLSIEALEDGTVIYYSLSEYIETPEPLTGSALPAFPAVDNDAATAAAQSFLDKVLTPGVESVVLEDPDDLTSLDSSTFRFNGQILLNGIPSPLSYSLTVRSSDNQVIRFWRDAPETMFLGDIPVADAKTTQSDAAAALKSTLSLRLEYILPDSDSTQAVLCYLPNASHEFYVDAQSGKLVDLTALEEEMYRFAGMGGAAADNGDTAATETEEGALSEAEQAGIAQLEGVLSSQELDSIQRSVKEYGLSGYELISSSFSVGTE